MRVRMIQVAGVLVACTVSLVGVASAQAPPVQKPAGAAKVASQTEQLHYEISVMEGVLQKAAENGARQTQKLLQPVLPGPLMWNAAPRAWGYRLESYGFVFNVEVPALSGSVVWSLQELDRNQVLMQAQLVGAVRTLRGLVQTVNDPRTRDQMNQTLRRIEVQIASDETPAVEGMAAQTVSNNAAARPPANPYEVYDTEVKNALIDAMLDYSAPLHIGADEWLTIAARDSESGRVSPAQPYDLATLILRVRGSDLAAFHAGRLSRDEARKKVEIRDS